MYIYAFGSVCRGEIDFGSDIDLLAIVDQSDDRLDPAKFSIYSRHRIEELWESGSPFAWHLFTESRLLFTGSGKDFIKGLGQPAEYKDVFKDCQKFLGVFEAGRASLRASRSSAAFDLSAMFLGVRNFATCFLLGVEGRAIFSRNAALEVSASKLPLSREAYNTLVGARILCTRGVGEPPTESEIDSVLNEGKAIADWMAKLLDVARLA